MYFLSLIILIFNRDVVGDITKHGGEKIANKEDISEINTWNDEIDTKLETADVEIKRLQDWLDAKEHTQKFAAQEEQFKYEIKLHEEKLRLQAELAKKSEITPETKESEAIFTQTAKLPKLVISKFEGSHMDWPRFWGQFTEAIDKSSIPPITKFTYLCELLGPKVKRCVEALPFTPEGYNRAKSVLLDQYGKESEIIKCYVKEIIDLPHITSSNPRKVAEFSEKLTYCVQALETMNKLSLINGNVSMTLEKLSGIRGDLVHTDPDWEAWDFVKLVESLHQWLKRNPVTPHEDKSKKLFHARDEFRPKGCVYCGDLAHKAVQCDKITDISERRRILAKKGLCFNCATKPHRAAVCTSKSSCTICNKRHHTSICDQTKDKDNDGPGNDNKQINKGPAKKLMTDGANGEGIFPIVVVRVNGITCRALIDLGASSSYASAKLINLLNIKPSEIKRQRVDMLMSSCSSLMESYDVNISATDESYSMNVNVTKVEKGQLLSVNNPEYRKLKQRYEHLKPVQIDDDDPKQQLPVHVILGTGEYSRIKTDERPLVGGDCEPVAERTKLGWFVMSPGADVDHRTMLLTQTSRADFESLCRLDVLGLADTSEEDQDPVYQDFKEQLVRDPAGWYEATLPWKAEHQNLPTNEKGSLRRLSNLVKQLERKGTYRDYDNVIQEQLRDGIIEAAPKESAKKEFYIPHKEIVKKSAETTKLRIVYEASAKESNSQPSLNDCLHPGPALQNQLWNILVRARFSPILLTGDLEKAFLQIRIRELERDSLRFHWKPPGSDSIEVYRFTRALFGLTCSPFLLGGVLNEHLNSWESRCPEIVKEIRDGLYVDDLMAGGVRVEEVAEKKVKVMEIFQDATFRLHKWHSNVRELEESSDADVDAEEPTYAKQQLGSKQTETKLLGLPWDKTQDNLSVVTCNEKPATTKRAALSQLAKVYDPLGLVSPTTLFGKLLYCEMCEAKFSWDVEFPEVFQKKWEEWCNRMPECFSVPRPLAPYFVPIESITLHAFGDASKLGVAAVVYAVVEQEQGTTQGLVCSKSRLAKKNLTIPRQELVGGHMAVNLASNVEAAIGVEKVCSIHCWLDSTVALYWIGGQGEYRQFVANQVRKIKEHDRVRWHYVPTKQNPADLGSRGGDVSKNELWLRGPTWLSNQSEWPADVVLEASSEVKEEEKRERVSTQALVTVSQERDEFDRLIETYHLRKVLRIGAWIQRFLRNCRNRGATRETGPLKTSEIEAQRKWWTRRVQQSEQITEDEKIQLNLQPNDDGLLECRGRIEGDYPLFLPRNTTFTLQVVEQAHLITLHGGVATTMAKVRERYWVPKLRQLVKQVRSKCWGCKRFRVKAFEAPPPGPLPKTRTQGSTPFEIVGVDFAGPIRYKKGKSEKKAYLSMFACSLCRAVHLELLKSLEAVEFVRCLKRFIVRCGKPKLIYSDNGTTFKATDKWLKLVQWDERVSGVLTEFCIEWRFNLSRAAWWCGQFERLIGLFKRSFHKTVGNGMLAFEELEEVVLDVERALNDRPLSYVENDVELPVLTPYSLLHVNPSYLPELESHNIDDRELRKREKFLKRCKESMWKRRSKEYIRSLREQHRRKVNKNGQYPDIGDAVIVHDGDEKNRNKWKLAIVSRLIEGRDGTVRAVKLRTVKGQLERSIQHLYPLELSCDNVQQNSSLNPTVAEFQPRSKRNTAKIAEIRIQDLAAEDGDEEL